MVGEKVFQGIGVSSGTALGRIFLREVVDLTFKNVKISQEQIAGEIERFQQAVERVTEALKYERSKVFEDLGQEEAEI